MRRDVIDCDAIVKQKIKYGYWDTRKTASQDYLQFFIHLLFLRLHFIRAETLCETAENEMNYFAMYFHINPAYVRVYAKQYYFIRALPPPSSPPFPRE